MNKDCCLWRLKRQEGDRILLKQRLSWREKKLHLLSRFTVCFLICTRIEDKAWIHLRATRVSGFDLLVRVGFAFCLERKSAKIRWIEMVLLLYRNFNGKTRKARRRRSRLIPGIALWIWFFFPLFYVRKLKFGKLNMKVHFDAILNATLHCSSNSIASKSCPLACGMYVLWFDKRPGLFIKLAYVIHILLWWCKQKLRIYWFFDNSLFSYGLL